MKRCTKSFKVSNWFHILKLCYNVARIAFDGCILVKVSKFQLYIENIIYLILYRKMKLLTPVEFNMAKRETLKLCA